MSAFVEIIFDNSDNRLPVNIQIKYRLKKKKFQLEEQLG
jgi:hypothetical protein